MGEKVTTHLTEIAFNTSRRSVRAALIPLIPVSDEMKKVIGIHLTLLFCAYLSRCINFNFFFFWKLIEFSQLLETLYPGTWYSREFTKAAMKSLPLGKSTWVSEGN